MIIIYNNESKISNISYIDNLNLMNIIYKFNSWKYSIRLFGEKFVKNNINNCYLLIGNNKIKLSEYLVLNEKQLKKNKIKIKLIEKKKITDMSYMFSGCESLKEFPDISQWDNKDVSDLS